MAFDAHANLVVTKVATAPSPATSGTSLVVDSGDGAKFPAVPFNLTISPDPTGSTPDAIADASEIVRVTNISTDTLTITRAQEGTSARTVVVGDYLRVGATKKTFTDMEAILKVYDFVTITSDVTVTATSEASPTTVITGSSVTYDGSTKVRIEFYAPSGRVGATSGNQMFVNLWDGASNLGRICLMQTPASANMNAPLYGTVILTPSAASHQYLIRAWLAGSSPNGTVNAASGSSFEPAFIRITGAA